MRLSECLFLSGVSVIHFMVASNQQSIQMSAFFDMLCVKYPSLNFLKVMIKGIHETASLFISLIPCLDHHLHVCLWPDLLIDDI